VDWAAAPPDRNRPGSVVPWHNPLPDGNLRRLAAVLRLGSRIFCAATQLLAQSLDNLSVQTMQRPATKSCKLLTGRRHYQLLFPGEPASATITFFLKERYYGSVYEIGRHRG
jgi:hypothetical protein